MIEFRGEVSQVIKSEVLKKARLQRGLWFLLLAALFYGGMIAGIAVKDMAFFWASLVVAVLVTLFALKLMLLPVPKKFINNSWNLQVRIDDTTKKIEYTQFLPKKNFSKSYSFKSVKKLIVKEYYYQLVGVGLPASLVLEKRLIQKGTFTQIEKLFSKKR